MPAPSYLPEAVPTALGWAHPLTGEQLDVTSGLEDAVDYYKPNSGAASFIDPEGETEFLGFGVVTGRRVKTAIHTLHPVVSVMWNWGDGSDEIEAGRRSMHIYDASDVDETYTITATVTYLVEGVGEDEGTMVEAEEEVTFDVTVESSLPATAVTGIALNDEGDAQMSLQEGATAQFPAFTITPVNATNTDVTYVSSATSVATVSAAGLTTAVAVGTATVTVTTVDGDFTADVEVTVTPAG